MVVLSGDAPEVPTGNVVLDVLLGPDIVWTERSSHYETEAVIGTTCDELAAEGRRPYRIDPR